MLEMLRFIYTGKAPSLDKMAADLLAAADKVRTVHQLAIDYLPTCSFQKRDTLFLFLEFV